MATIQNLLKNALWDAIKGNATLWDSVGGRVFYIHPVAGVSYPYMTYSFAASGPFNVMQGSGPVAYTIPVFFDIFSQSSVTTQAEEIQAYVHSLFDMVSLNITGYSPVKFLRASEIMLYDQETQIWHAQIGYDAIASKD